MMDNFDRVRALLPDTVLESRLDSAFFSRKTLTLMDLYGVEATVSVPFERFPVLKQMIAARRRWLPLDGERSYFESDWNPDSWSASYRFLFVRRKVRRQVKGALQLDLFEPRKSTTTTVSWSPTRWARPTASSSSITVAARRKGFSRRASNRSGWI